jgi:predicted transcriptional regulator
MTQHERQYSPTVQSVLTLLQQHPGEYFTAEDVCEHTDCSTGQAQLALDTLANDGLVTKEPGSSGHPEYAYR